MMSRPLKKFLEALSLLQQTIFAIYIRRDFAARKEAYEKKILTQTENLMAAMQAVRKVTLNSKTLADLEQLYELTFSLDLLKNRLIDYSTFALCELELKNIAQVFQQVIHDVVNDKIDTTAIREKLDAVIQSLETIFENTLQIVCADPSIFLFFIRELYAFSGRLADLRNGLGDKSDILDDC